MSFINPSKLILKLAILLSAGLGLFSCNRSDDSFNVLESGGEGKSACKITGMKPETKEVRVSSTSGVKSQFIVQSNSENCKVEYSVNGEVFSNNGSMVAEIDADIFKPNKNVVKVTVSSASGSESFEWEVTKNTPPTCSSQVPSNLNPTMAAESELLMTINSTDAENDPLEFNWKYNGVSNAQLMVPVISSSKASQIRFLPSAQHGGTQTVAAVVSDGYDSVSCSWSVRITGDCSITAKSPDVSGNNVRILSPSSSQNSFSITTATAGCSVNWTINGVPQLATTSSLILNSSRFANGNNVLTASVSGATGVSSQTWMVEKNSPPSCGTLTPSNLSTQVVGIGQSLSLGITASDSNSDPLSFSWLLNSASVSSSILSSSASGLTSNATFLPTSSQVGVNNVSTVISDGYESTTCNWPIQVLPACEITASTPDHTVNRRYAASSSQVSTFTVTPNYPSSCSVSWSIDGSAVSSGTVLNLTSTNPLLSVATPHTLTATVSNGTGAPATRSWTLIKNAPPSCSGYSPSATGQSYVEGSGAHTLILTAADAESDPMTFSWSLNGASHVNLSTLGNTATTSSASFSPDISNVGTNLVSVAVNDGYDTTSCPWSINVTGACSTTGFSPSNASRIPIANFDLIGKTLGVTTSTAGCPVTWKVRGGTIAGTTSSKILDSSYFVAGENIVEAIVTNGSTTSSTTWTIYKNTPPTGATSPSNSTPLNVALSSPRTFVVDVTDVDLGPSPTFTPDSLTATWKLNGIAISSLNPSLTNSVLSATDPFSSSFTFDANYTGSRQLTLSVSDGLDTTDFSWDLSVFSNCAVTASFPAGATQRSSATNNITTTYGVIPNDSSCTVSWELNGASFGADGNLKDVNSLSSGLLASNTLVATLDNGVGTPATRTWTIQKNVAPTCQAGQSPAASGNTMEYDDTLNLSCTADDYELDPLTTVWKLNNNSISGIFDNISASGNNFSARFNPSSIGYVGNGQVISSTFNDGWDNGFCQWSLDITDPAAVQIQACTPLEGGLSLKSKYSDSPLKYDIKTFTVSASGPGITYKWKTGPDLSSLSEIAGETSAQLKVSTSLTDTYTGDTPDVLWAVGTRPLVVEVIDQYNNVATCTWSMKRNSAPAIDTSVGGTNSTGFSLSVDGASLNYNSKVRMNYSSTMTIRVYGTDPDLADRSGLDYRWKINGQLLPDGGGQFLSHTEAGDATYSTATINPAFNSSYLGAYTLTVQISDGEEVYEQNFNIEINMFSKDCNTLFNSPSTGTGEKGADVCTLIGQAGVGADRSVSSEASKMRFQPWDFTWDGNNIIFTDQNTHSIFYYNRGTTSGDDVIRFGKSIPHDQVVAISGLGNAGLLVNMVTASSDFKYNSPRQIAYHNGRLYVADFSNNRIVVIKEDGVASSFVGRISDNAIPANDVNSNSTTGAAGTSQRCEEASGLVVVNESGTNYLYFGCRYSIKKAYIHDHSSPNYGRTQVVAGKLFPAGNNADGRENGHPLNAARVSRPRALDVDNDGNIYWTEAHGSVRVLNRSVSTLNFFQGKYNSGVTTIEATDYLNSGGTFSTNVFNKGSVLAANNAASLLATKLVVHAPTDSGAGTNVSMGVNYCYPIRVQLQDASNLTATYGSDVSFTMSANDAAFSFYANFSNCNSSTPTQTAYTITTGQNEVELWVKGNAAVSGKTITATSATVTSGSIGNVRTLATSGAATTTLLGFFAQPSMHFQSCARVWVVPANGTNPTNPASSVSIRLVSYNGGNFYASNDPTCSGNPINSITFSGGATSYAEGFLYFARTTKVLPGEVGTLFGMQNATLGTQMNLAISPSTPQLGSMQFRQGYGFQVNASGSNVLGFFLSSYDYDVVTYVNNNDSSGAQTGTQYVGGVTFGSAAASTGQYHTHQIIAGSSDSCNGSIPTSSFFGLLTPSYNGDSKLGVQSRLCFAGGMSIDPTGDYLYIGDLWNWRIRKMRLSAGAGNSILSSELGQGRARFGWYGDASIPAEDATFIFPTDVIYDPTDKALLVSDMGNGRIRKIDLTKGTFETHVGRGVGDMTVPVEDPFAMQLGGPGQMALIRQTGVSPLDLLLFVDARPYQNNAASATNLTCALRAYNRDLSNNQTVFGELVSAGRVANLAGVYDYGCNSIGSQAGSSTYGGMASDSSLKMPVGFVTDGTSGYIADFLDHCILKISSSGVLSNFIGNCGVSGSADGFGNGINGSNLTYVRYPMQMVMDPVNPGNFFYTEGYDQTLGKIHYANVTTSIISFANGVSVPSKGANLVSTATVWNFGIAGTNAYINGIAAFENKWICISSGGSVSNSPILNQTLGGHGVYCFDRADSGGSAVRIIGSNPSSNTRAGNSLGKADELKAGTSSYMYQPHGIAFDSDGNLYIAERGSHVVKMIRRWW